MKQKLKIIIEHTIDRLRRYENPLVILASAIGLSAILLNLEFNLLEANLYDFRTTNGRQSAPSSEIVLVTLDDKTARAVNDFAPLPLDQHARLLEKLEAHQPRAIGYLVNMNFVSQVNPDLFDHDWGRRFINAARRLDTRGTPVILGTPFDVNGEVIPPYPLSSLKHAVAVIHRDGNVFSADKVTRRALTTLYGKPTFHLRLAREAGLIAEDHTPAGSFYVPEVDSQYIFFRYHGDTSMRTEAPETAGLPYRVVSFSDILEGKTDTAQLRGKILLVGTLSRENPSDFALTPYSKSPFVNPKLVIHANILDTIQRDSAIHVAPEWVNWLSTFLVTAFVLWWVLNSTPLYGVIATFSLALLFVVIGQLLFQGVAYLPGLWIKEAQPLVGIFLGYYLVVPYRLIREYKKRWDYQRRNDLLLQVEELKTNFLSLVTHDLKTPVARIQGLSEVLLSKAGPRLEDHERKTVRHIIDSTDELNRFISSILELTKIESNRIQLNLESKDVNLIIERVVDGLRTQARTRDVDLMTELEPLFPIKLDPSLITKVLNNLVDNAIKYSPAGSNVTVRSKETGEWVEISVIDQGIGLSPEEKEHLFTKFYRAKNSTTAKVAGTGLGLYLTKYFIEIHQGSVSIDSQAGFGSTFTIRLPIEIGATVDREPGLVTRLERAATDLVARAGEMSKAIYARRK